MSQSQSLPVILTVASQSLPWPWITSGLAGSLVAYFYITRSYGRNFYGAQGLKRPPGPKPRPVIGNIPDFPKQRWYEKFCEWQKEYELSIADINIKGDVVYVNLMGTSFLVINSLEHAEELANKRSTLYSGRPYVRMMADLMGFGWSLTMRQADKEFNEQRKVFRKVIGPQSVSFYDPLVQNEAERLVKSFYQFSGDPTNKVEDSVGAVVTKLAYGEKIYQEYGQELIDLNKENIRHLGAVRTTFYLVSVIPWLRYVPEWFPGAQFQTVAKIGKVMTTKIRTWAFGLVVKDMENGLMDPSVISSFLGDSEFSKESLRDATAILYSGAVETTASSILSYLYRMAIHPEIQQQVHKELDEAIGRGNTPSVDDCLKLRYLEATWKENIRMAPPGPLGLPHATQENDSWNGYYIPKGTVVNFNIGFMMKDPRTWGPDAQEFKPERFLKEDSNKLPDVLSLVFGFGKRICPGRYLANRNARAFAAAILSAYDILPIEGETIPEPMPYTDFLVRRPSDFRCQFIPRV